MTSWSDHLLCAPRATMPSGFWGPEKLDSAAFVELVDLLSPDVEIAALLVALKDIKQVVDVGGGTGLLTQAIAKGAEVTVIEPDPAQRALVRGGIIVADGRAEAIPLPGWLLAHAATQLEAAGFTVTLQRLAIPVRAPAGGAEQLAGTLARLHFAGHPKLAEMIEVTTPLIGRTLAIGGALSDDGVLLSARR